MNSPFQQFKKNLTNEELQKLHTDELRIGVNDNHYRLTTKGTILKSTDTQSNLKKLLSENQDQILKEPYQSHPLCKDEFNYQATQLLNNHSAENYCKYESNPNHISLMIDNERLISIVQDDPRNQYGYFYNHHSIVDDNEALRLVTKWINSGLAYEDYRVKTHCRYICASN